MVEVPAVSVVMSAFNAGQKIRKSVESVLSQDFTNFDFIILDDASTDGTLDILKEYARNDPRIKIIASEKNQGLTRNLARGVSLSRSEYIARIDAGDYWTDDKLSKQWTFLESHPDHVLCASQANFITSGQVVGVSDFATEDAELRKRLFTRKPMLLHPTLFFRNVLNYRIQFRFSQDLDLCARLSFLGKIHCLPDRLLFCEVGNEGITVNSKFFQRQFQNHAYRLFLQRFHSGKDELDSRPEMELPLRKSALEKKACSFAVFFFRLFIKHKLKKSSLFIWLTFFGMSLALYPPFFKDYALRFLLIRKFRKSPWESRDLQPVPLSETIS